MIMNHLQENSVLMNSCYMIDVSMVHVCFYTCTLNAIEVTDIIWPFKWFSFSKPYVIIPSQFFLQNLWTLQRTDNGGTGQ